MQKTAVQQRRHQNKIETIEGKFFFCYIFILWPYMRLPPHEATWFCKICCKSLDPSLYTDASVYAYTCIVSYICYGWDLTYSRMRSNLVVRASDCQCTSCNGPGFDPSIRRRSGIWGAADEAVLNTVRKKQKNKKKYLKKRVSYIEWGKICVHVYLTMGIRSATFNDMSLYCMHNSY